MATLTKFWKWFLFRYVLLKDELILKTVAIFVQKAGSIWQQGGFSPNYYSIQYTNVIVLLKSFTTLDSPLSSLKHFETKLGKQLGILKNN